jgi:hypothetical protein
MENLKMLVADDEGFCAHAYIEKAETDKPIATTK